MSFAADLRGSPALFPLTLDDATGQVGFVTLSETDYRAASFLDERLLGEPRSRTWARWSEVEAAATPLAPACDFIFHIGHVGSTLLSRLLEVSEAVFSLREPAILRALARTAASGETGANGVEHRAGVCLGLWSRVWRPGQRSLIKATSFVADIAPGLMRLAPASRALLMFVAPQVYAAGILAGEASRRELRAMAPLRLAMLHRRLGGPLWRLEDLGEGELCALSWTVAILGLAEAARDFGPRVLWLDFEDFLARPRAGLAAALGCLQGEADLDLVAAMLRAPDFGRYAKAPEYAYDAALRRRLIAEARAEHGEAIERALAWITAAGRAHESIAAATRLAAAAPRLA